MPSTAKSRSEASKKAAATRRQNAKRRTEATPQTPDESQVDAKPSDLADANEAYANGPQVENVNFENADKAESPDIEGPIRGRVDNRTRRTGGEALEGHFVTIDRTAKGVNTDLLPAGQDGYGVFTEVASVGDDGYPETVLVRLRDNSHATIEVPFAAITAAEAGGR